MKRKTTEQFINEAKEVHGDRYDYSNTVYVTSLEKVIIYCNKHGAFWQKPSNHLRGEGCNACGFDKMAEKLKNKVLERKFKGLVQPEGYKLIPLSRGSFAKVDNEDFDKLKTFNWSENKQGYAVSRNLGYMHRFIINPVDSLSVDHINRDKLDNRRSNLRVCSHKENMNNQSLRVGCSSQYKGVSWDKNRNKWASSITNNYKNIYIGRFETEIEAAKAYDAKARELFGEFAHTNF